MSVALYDIEASRHGALGILELEAGSSAIVREEVEEALELHLDTMGPGDRLTLVVVRR